MRDERSSVSVGVTEPQFIETLKLLLLAAKIKTNVAIRKKYFNKMLKRR